MRSFFFDMPSNQRRISVGIGSRSVLASLVFVAVAVVIASALILQTSILPAHAKGSPIYTAKRSDIAAGGHDVVAYFRDGKPQVGNARFSHRWQGATWHFASEAHRAAFVARPEAFAPAYGGHCAWAASQGYKASGDPLQWRIVDGRLFLNYNAEIKARWETDISGFVAKGDTQWTTLATK